MNPTKNIRTTTTGISFGRLRTKPEPQLKHHIEYKQEFITQIKEGEGEGSKQYHHSVVFLYTSFLFLQTHTHTQYLDYYQGNIAFLHCAEKS